MHSTNGTATATAPSDMNGVDVATLETVDLARLTKKEPAEIRKLLDASCLPGFFYLDLRNDELGVRMLADLAEVYNVSEKYFDQDEKTKAKDARTDQKPSQDKGYKRSSCDETFEMARDEMSQSTFKLPGVLGENASVLKRFSENCDAACYTMLSSLSDALQLQGSRRFEESHRRAETSDSGLKLIYEPSLEKLADVGENLHTDSGTFTLLFYDLWGLHAEVQDAKHQWAFIAPKDGCALINVADSLHKLSGDRLHSPRHRVTQPGDGFAKRYYLSYFLRPEHAVKERWSK